MTNLKCFKLKLFAAYDVKHFMESKLSFIYFIHLSALYIDAIKNYYYSSFPLLQR